MLFFSCKDVSKKAGKQIADGVVSAIYERFDGTTWYLQKVLNQLFATKDIVGISDVDKAVKQIINQNEEAIQYMGLSHLSLVLSSG